jgi:hypothetical protein
MGLHDEDILIACTAPSALSTASEFDCSKAVRCAVVYCPWALVGAHVCFAAVVTRVLCGHVRERVVLLVTALDGLVHRSLARPSTGALAAIPITCLNNCVRCQYMSYTRHTPMVTYRSSSTLSTDCKASGQSHETELLKRDHCVIQLVFNSGGGARADTADPIMTEQESRRS